MSAVCFGNQFGDGGLDAGCVKGMTDAVNGKNKLIQTELFCSERIGKIDTINKADDSGNQAGGSQDKSAFYKCGFFHETSEENWVIAEKKERAVCLATVHSIIRYEIKFFIM